MDAYIKELEEKLRATSDELSASIQGIRSGRPTPQLLENIKVSAYDQVLLIKELGTISIKPPREITVLVWDAQVAPHVAKAIQDAHIGLQPSLEGNSIRCFLPPLSEERREEMIKLVKRTSEEARIKIRSIRDEINKKVKGSESDEDAIFRTKENIQKAVDSANTKIEEIVKAKIEELKE